MSVFLHAVPIWFRGALFMAAALVVLAKGLDAYTQIVTWLPRHRSQLRCARAEEQESRRLELAASLERRCGVDRRRAVSVAVRRDRRSGRDRRRDRQPIHA